MEDCPMESPTPRPTSRLPVQLGTFVGRARELETLRRLLPDTRLLTLTGSGGVGKTRLAIELTRSVDRAFHDGVALVELGGQQDAALVRDTIASVLGAEERAHRPDQRRVRASKLWSGR
jgi:predicted ATPase